MKKLILLLSVLSLLLISACNSDSLLLNDLSSDKEQFVEVVNVGEGIDVETYNAIANTVKDVRQGKVKLNESQIKEIQSLIHKYGLFDLIEVAFPDEDLEIVTLKSGMKVRKKDDFYVIGDILYTEEQIYEFYGNGESDNPGEIGLRASFTNKSSLLWPGNIVFYHLSTSMSSDTRQAALDAMAHWSSVSAVQFQAKGLYTPDYINFINGSGSYSQLGRVGGAQNLSLDASLADKGTALHEIAHAIGMHHEHQKYNRDSYITVHFNYIKPDTEIVAQFTKVANNTSIYSVIFDSQSITCYGSYNAAGVYPNVATMTGTNGTSTWTAQRNAPSYSDLQLVSCFYY